MHFLDFWAPLTFCLAAENLVPFSEKEPSIFKSGQLTPLKDLKLLVKDYAVRMQFQVRKCQEAY